MVGLTQTGRFSRRTTFHLLEELISYLGKRSLAHSLQVYGRLDRVPRVECSECKHPVTTVDSTVRISLTTRVDKPRLVFVRKRPAMWKCSECGHKYSIERRIRPQSAEERLSEIERDFEKHVLEIHPRRT